MLQGLSGVAVFVVPYSWCSPNVHGDVVALVDFKSHDAVGN